MVLIARYFQRCTFSLMNSKLCSVLACAVLLWSRSANSENEGQTSDSFPCGPFDICFGRGYNVCVMPPDVDTYSDSMCYSCSAFKNTCGKINQRQGCHLYCLDLMLQKVQQECNKTIHERTTSTTVTSYRPTKDPYFMPFVAVTVLLCTKLLALVVAFIVYHCQKQPSVGITGRWRESSTDEEVKIGSLPRQRVECQSDANLPDLTDPRNPYSGPTSPDPIDHIQPSPDPIDHTQPSPDPIDHTQPEPREDEQLLPNPDIKGDDEHYCESKLKNVNPAQKDEGEMHIN